MTLSAYAQGKTDFTNLKQQFDALVRDTPAPPNEIGQLPASQSRQLKRKTLHLKSEFKKKDTKVVA